ncbi:MAG: NAD(P)H-hydrate dehydratase [Deltaproteobacteria bacterium]|nr:NAD(P)H-hydrate dehydratase [Deltaproteobacteria bacterium]
MRLVDSKQMQEMDRHTIEVIGITGLVLMENAARSWVAAAEPILKQARKITIFCGAGNNGGDGYAIARNLVSQGFSCRVVAVKPPKSLDCIENARIWESYGETINWDQFHEFRHHLSQNDVIVDAILGTGVESDIRGSLVEKLQEINLFPGIKMAVDIPSGISASTGNLLGVGLQADHTITFQLEKVGHHLYPGKTHTGKLCCQKITIREHFFNLKPEYHLIDADCARTYLPKRQPDDYKNCFGHLAVLCGNSGTTGAAVLASHGAIKTGLGLLTAALPKSEQNVFLSRVPELMTYPREDISADWLTHFDAVVVGCGLGRYLKQWNDIENLLRDVNIPAVIDADGFYGISNWQSLHLENLVLTPHPGEFVQLSGYKKPKCNLERIAQGISFVEKYPTTLVLKGAPTLVFSREGEIFINSTGNVGMATAGSGDVLAGIVGGLLAQGLSPLQSALLGTWLHGKSGDLYRTKHCEESLTASCLIEYLSQAFRELKQEREKPSEEN